MNKMSQLKEKYTSRQAQNYKAYLEKKVEAAMKNSPAVAVKELDKAAKPKTAEDELWDSLNPDASKDKKVLHPHPSFPCPTRRF